MTINSIYFTKEELQCQETGELKMSQDFIDTLDSLRANCDFPFVVTSGYRSPEHSLEKRKEQPGAHALGLAIDIRSNSKQKAIIMDEAKKLGFTRFGINKSFIHIDLADTEDSRFPSNVVWAY